MSDLYVKKLVLNIGDNLGTKSHHLDIFESTENYMHLKCLRCSGECEFTTTVQASSLCPILYFFWQEPKEQVRDALRFMRPKQAPRERRGTKTS